MKYLILILVLTISACATNKTSDSLERQRDKRENCVKDTMPGSKVPVYRC